MVCCILKPCRVTPISSPDQDEEQIILPWYHNEPSIVTMTTLQELDSKCEYNRKQLVHVKNVLFTIEDRYHKETPIMSRKRDFLWNNLFEVRYILNYYTAEGYSVLDALKEWEDHTNEDLRIDVSKNERRLLNLNKLIAELKKIINQLYPLVSPLQCQAVAMASCLEKKVGSPVSPCRASVPLLRTPNRACLPVLANSPTTSPMSPCRASVPLLRTPDRACLPVLANSPTTSPVPLLVPPKLEKRWSWLQTRKCLCCSCKPGNGWIMDNE